MKFEIDIPDDELREAVQKAMKDHALRVIASKVSGYSMEAGLKTRVNALWDSEIDDLIHAELKNSGRLRTAIVQNIEKKLRSKIANLLNADTSAVSEDANHG